MIETARETRSIDAHFLQGFLFDCVNSGVAQEAWRLQQAATLFRLNPERRAALAAMIACRAYESAALLVLGDQRPFLLSRGASGICLASAVCADGEDDVTVEAETPTLALLAAHAAVLLAENGQAGASSPARRSSADPARLH